MITRLIGKTKDKPSTVSLRRAIETRRAQSQALSHRAQLASGAERTRLAGLANDAIGEAEVLLGTLKAITART